MMRTRPALCVLLLICCVACLASAQTASPVATPPSAPAWRSDPKFQDAIRQARLYQRQQRFGFAQDEYKKANKIAGGLCQDCLVGLYTAQVSEGNFKDAVSTSGLLLTLASTPAEKSVALYRRGEALYRQGGSKPKPAQLEAAHDALQQAIAAYPKNAAALFTDGKVLARLGRTEDARADFQQCLSCTSATDPSRLRVQHFAENPELATHVMAPAFDVTALDGSHFNLDAMGGRVVLIDFWATWCGPCNQELPHIKKIAREFAGQPLVIISVSWDKDEEKWKQFVQKNEMTWVQYRDADHHLSDLFEINAIPHYFTIDSDGVLTSEMLGEGADVEGKLKKLLARAREAQRPPAAQLSSGSN